MIKIKDTLKSYGKDLTLWYHPYQGETFQVGMDTKLGYLVHNPYAEGTKMYLVKHNHAEEVDFEESDDEIV